MAMAMNTKYKSLPQTMQHKNTKWLARNTLYLYTSLSETRKYKMALARTSPTNNSN